MYPTILPPLCGCSDHSATAAARTATASPAASIIPMRKPLAAPSKVVDDAEGEPVVTDGAVPFPAAMIVVEPTDGGGVVEGLATADVIILVETLSLVETAAAEVDSVALAYVAEELM